MAEGENGSPAPVDVIKMQQEFYQMFGHNSSVIYDCYTSKESLEVKIDLILPENPRKGALIDLLWQQRKFMGDKYLLMSPIFISCIHDWSPEDHLTYPLNIRSKKFSVHSVFRIQKCLSTVVDEKGQQKCCALFIDEYARVYANWKDFREKNKCEDGLVIAPKCGIYNGSDDGSDRVLLDIFVRKSGLTKNLDTGSTVVGLASAGVAAAAFIPSLAVAPVIAAGATVAGISCAVYTGIRSAYNLYDRRNHKQSITLKDKEARASWFNIAAGTLTASAAGATQLITQAAQSGQNISHITRNTVRLMNLSALGLHTTGCLDSFHTMIYNFYNGEPISKVHLAQLSASLFLLTHSISNYQRAEQLLRSCDSQNPDSMKQMLCQQQKLTFEHLVTETALIRGLRSDIGQIVVRSIKSLGDPKELLKFIEMHQEPLVVEATENVQELLDKDKENEKEKEKENENETIETDPDELVVKQEDFCLGVLPNVATEYGETFDKRFESILMTLEQQVKNRGTISLKTILIFLLDDMTFKTFNIFLNFTQELVVRSTRTIEEKLNEFVPFERFVKLIYAQFAKRIDQQNNRNKTFNEFIVLQSDEQLAAIDFDIRDFLSGQTNDTMDKFEKDFDDEHTYKMELSDNRKVFLLIDERVQEFSNQFKMCCATANINELHETIEEILKRLSYQSATIFFALAKKLLNDHADNIQIVLGRFISKDVFLTDIYCLLTKLSANHCDSLNEYLFEYTDDLYDDIEAEFKNSYVLTNDVNLKKSLCTVCAGEIFA